MTWGEDWGGLWGIDSPAQVYLPDTVFFGDSTTGIPGELRVDESQVATDMTAGATWIYEASPATRYSEATEEWTVDAVVEMDNADTGFIFATAPSQRFSIRVGETAGLVRIRLGIGGVNTTIASLTAPGVSASPQRFLISWASEANPLTTGASDAARSELRIWNLDTGEYDQTVATHAFRDTGNGTATWAAQTTAGGTPFSGTLYAARFGQAFHHSRTVRESFVDNVVAPTLHGSARREVLVPTSTTGIGDDGEFAGPIYLQAALDNQQKDLWLVGPLVNEQYWDLVNHNGGLTASSVVWTVPDPDQTGRHLYLAYLYRRPVPLGVTQVAARVFVQQYRGDANPADNLHISLHSMSQPGPHTRPTTSPLEYTRYVATVSNADDHGSGSTAGEWYDLGPINIAKDKRGYTYLCLGFRVSDAGGAGSTDDQLWRVKAFVVEPV